MNMYGEQIGGEILAPPIVDEDSNYRYEPWQGPNGEMGYRVTSGDGKTVRYFYLNPSGGSDDGVPTIFVYDDYPDAPHPLNAVSYFDQTVE